MSEPINPVERVRYFKRNEPYNSIFKQDNERCFWWNGSAWILQQSLLVVVIEYKELTESEVIALIGREAVFGKEEPKAVEPDGPVEMAHCDKCGLGTNKWHTFCDFCLDETLNEKPQWLPVSQCDLKPGEAFWFGTIHGVEGYCNGASDIFNWFAARTNYTHYCRALPPYAIPKPPVVESVKEDDGFEKVWNQLSDQVQNTVPKIAFRMGWNARASITEKGCKDE